MINTFGKILVINLDRDHDRYKKFIESFQGSCLIGQLVRFRAVDGKNLDIRIVDKNILTDVGRASILSRQQKRFGVSLTYGAIGCALSHYLILKDCSNQTLPYLIFEDDARIIENFDKEISLLSDHVNNLEYDILYLGLHDIPALNKTANYDNMLYTPKGLTCGTWAMIITPTGAQKILDMVFPLSVQIDSEISKNKSKLRIYAAKKELAKHSWEFGSNTQQQKGCETLVG